MLDDQAPARLLRTPGKALEAHYKLFEFVARQHLGLSGHGQSFGTPLTGPLWQFGESCHTRLDNRYPVIAKVNYVIGPAGPLEESLSQRESHGPRR